MATSRHVGVAIETTWGTPVAPSGTNFAEAISEDLQLVRNFENIETIRSPLISNVVEQNSIVEGSVTLKANYQDLGPWLYLLCGSVTSNTASPVVHTYSISTTSVRDNISATIEVSRGTTTRTWRYAGCKVESWAHTQAEGAGEITVGVVGKSEATGTQATASYPANDIILAQHGTTLSLDAGTSSLCVTNFDMNINWPLDRTVCHGSSTLSRQPGDTGVIVAEGTLTAIFEDGEMTEYGYYDGSTDVNVVLTYTDGTHSLSYQMATCRLISATPFLNGRERLTGDFVFRAFGSMTIVLTNDDASVTG